MELNSEFTEKWFEIKALMNEGKYSSVIKEAYPFLEQLLRKLILESIPKLDYKTRKALYALEDHLRGGKKGIENFELGPIIQILTSPEVDWITAISQKLDKDPEILRSVNFDYLRLRRNEHGHEVRMGTHSVAQYFISSIEIILSFFDLKIIDYEKLQEEISSLKKELAALKEQKGSVEEFSTVSMIYENYDKILSQMDFKDTGYYEYDDPFVRSITATKDLYEKVHYGALKPKRLRGILNLHNKHPLPWLLLYRFVKDFDDIKDGNYQYRGFYGFSNTSHHLPLVSTVLIYSAKEIDNGYLVLHLFQNEIKQRNLLIQNKAIFKFFRSAYDELFQSSEILDIERIKKIYEETYGTPNSISDLEENIRLYYSKLPDSDEDMKQAVEVWKQVFNL